MLVKKIGLECDNVVIGSGLAGMVAALRLNGDTILLSHSHGATSISTGAISYSGQRDADAEGWFLENMHDTSCPYVRGKSITDMFAYVEGIVPENTALGDKDYTFISINGLPACTDGFMIKPLKFMEGRSFQEMAGNIEKNEAALKELENKLSLIDDQYIIMPPILGLRSSLNIRKGLESATGKEIVECLSAPSALGMRSMLALREKVMGRKNIRIIDMAEAESIGYGRVEGRMGTKAKREFFVSASNLILATGGPLTGLRIQDDSIYEPLTGLSISSDIISDLNDRFLSTHPIMKKGIGTHPSLRLGFKDIRAAGAVAVGFGLYGALVTGYHAGDGL